MNSRFPVVCDAQGARPVRRAALTALALVSALSAGSGCSTPAAQITPEAREAAPALAAPRACALASAGRFVPTARSSSTVALVRDGQRAFAFIADEDTRRIAVVDLEQKREIAHAELEGVPSELLVTAGGSVAVALPELSKVSVLTFDGKNVEPLCNVAAPSEPVSLALTPDAQHLLVTSAWGHALTSYGAKDLAQQYSMQLGRDPRAIAIEDSGRRAFVSHAVGGTVSVVDLTTRQLQTIDVNRARSTQSKNELLAQQQAMSMPASETEQAKFDALLKRPERLANQGFSLAISNRPDGRVLIPLVQVDPGDPEQRSSGYGSMGLPAAEPAVAVVDTQTLKVVPTDHETVQRWGVPPVTAGNETCLLPRANVLDPESGMLLVACMGADSVIGFDSASPSPIDAEVFRMPVAAGPTGIALDPGHARAVVWSQFERALSIVTWDPAGAELSTELRQPEFITLAPVQGRELPIELAVGRRLFFATEDTRISSDGRACASCHISGRDDGLVWSTPHGPRRTKMLSGLLTGTAPYAWDGNAKDVEGQVRHTFARLSGQGGLRSADLRSLVSYVQALPAPHNGYAKERAELVERGAQVFASAETGCAQCHGGRSTTDGARHDVESNVTADASNQFDTPSLRFLSGRAPYFHDGRYTDLQALLEGCDGTMGHTNHLSQPDFTALKAYLEVL